MESIIGKAANNMSEDMAEAETLDHPGFIRKLDLLGRFADDLAHRIESEKLKQFRINR